MKLVHNISASRSLQIPYTHKIKLHRGIYEENTASICSVNVLLWLNSPHTHSSASNSFCRSLLLYCLFVCSKWRAGGERRTQAKAKTKQNETWKTQTQQFTENLIQFIISIRNWKMHTAQIRAISVQSARKKIVSFHCINYANRWVSICSLNENIMINLTCCEWIPIE